MPAKGDTHLYELIKSLTKQEKADLYKNAFKGKINNIYFKVYKLIDTAEVYNEESIIKRVGIKKERLSEIKNYLTRIILKNLESIHGNNIEEIHSFQELSQIMVLKYKGLFDQCLKRINLVLKKAIEREDYIVVVFLLELRDEINSRYTGEVSSADDLQRSFETFYNASKHFIQTGYYKYQMWKAFLPTSVYEKKPFDLSFQIPPEKGNIIGNEPDTFLKQILSMASFCRLAILKKDHKETINISSKALAIINKSPKRKFLPVYLGYGFVNAHMLACLSTGEYERAFQSLKNIESFLRSSGSEYQNNLDLYYFNINKMSLYAAASNFQKVIELGNTYFINEKHLLKKMPESFNLFSYLMGYSYFMIGENKKANKHLGDLINLPNQKVLRIDFFIKALFVDLLQTLEKGDSKLAENKLRTYERLLRTNNYYDEYEKLMVIFLKNYINSEPTSKFFNDQKELTGKKLEALDNYFYHKRYFDFIKWLEKKATSS